MTQNEEIQKLFFHLQKKMHQQIRDSESEFPLSRTEMMALMAIRESQGSTVGDLVELFGVRKSSVSIMIHKLKKKGLVELRVDENDKRLSRISITNDAKSVLRKMKRVMSKHMDLVLGNLSVEEKDSFIEILRKVVG